MHITAAEAAPIEALEPEMGEGAAAAASHGGGLSGVWGWAAIVSWSVTCCTRCSIWQRTEVGARCGKVGSWHLESGAGEGGGGAGGRGEKARLHHQRFAASASDGSPADAARHVLHGLTPVAECRRVLLQEKHAVAYCQ